MVQQIIKEFDELFKVLDTFDKENFYDYRRGNWMFYPHKGNVRIAANTWRAVAELWAAHRAPLRTWIDTYFEGNKQEIYNKFYLDAGWQLMSDNLNPHWRFKEADSDFLEFCPDLAAWRAAEELVRAARPRMDFRNCDDPQILAAHEGYPCNGGLICILCDDMEHDWCGKIEAEVRRTDNIFLNKASRAAFAGREAATWTGPPMSAQQAPVIPSIDGKTPFKAMQALIAANWPIASTFWDYGSGIDNYETFMRLWAKYDFIDEHLDTFVATANEIEALL